MKKCPLCVVVVSDLAEKCPHCHGKLMVVKSSERVRRGASPWLLLVLAGLLMLAWDVWRARHKHQDAANSSRESVIAPSANR